MLKGSGKLVAVLMVSTILVAFAVNTSHILFVYAQTPVPVSGAYVYAWGKEGELFVGSGSANSTSQGTYNITTFLGSGNYWVSASAPGFIDSTVENVKVTSGNETSNVILNMKVSGAMSGRITDAVSNAPVQEAEVQAYSSEILLEASTVSDGTFLIYTNLYSGTYNVTARATGYLPTTIGNVVVIAGKLTSGANIALGRSAIITGTVKDAVTGAPLNGIDVSASTTSSEFVASDTTNSSGIYTLNTNLGTGTYDVYIDWPIDASGTGGHVPEVILGLNITAGNTYTQNISLPLSGIMSGRITTPAGKGIAGVEVNAYEIPHPGFYGYYGYAETDSTGFYRIADGLGTGTYTLQAHYPPNDLFNTTIANVTAGSETTNVNLQINDTVPPTLPSGNITGRVTDITGNPIISAPVIANTFYAAWVAEAISDATGNYTISGLPTGIYNVIVQGISGPDFFPYYLPQTKSNIDVTANQETSNIDFQLILIVSGRISGIVQTTETPVSIPEFPAELYVLAIFVTVSTIIVLKKFRNLRLKP